MIKRLYFTQVSQAWASDEDIANAERECGCKLPIAFKDFCRIYNGGFPDDRNSCYPVPKKYSDYHREYREDWVMADVLYGLGRDPLPWNLLDGQKSLGTNRPPILVLTKDGLGGSIAVKKEDPDGPVFLRDHYLWLQVADSLEEFYNGLGPDPLAGEDPDEE